MKNKLSGSILEQDNCDMLVFLDSSVYLPDAKNYILRITAPNWTSYKDIEYNPNQVTTVTNFHLNLDNLPSGVYNICQSVCPNESTSICFKYFHVCCERARLNELACSYLAEDKDLTKIFNLKYQLEIIQGIVNLDESKAISLYNATVDQLDDLENKNCC